ncbi:MAG: RnfABCDGE type electron transport complex subunit B [Treponema sp.]|nr:RnfABCDGE type electron transport complex subunit B [Treponema sp.]
MNAILIAVVVSFLLAFIIGVLLGVFKKIFYVPVDEKAAAVREVLPGANCGGCGYPGCDGFAAACAAGKAPADGCTAGGVKTAQAVANVLGVHVSAENTVAVLACQGSKDKCMPRGCYNGIHSCAAAHEAVNGTKMCQWGCIGFGDCVAVCNFDALYMGSDSLPHVNTKKCTGCGVCVKTCPMHLLFTVPVSRKGAVALCSNRNENKAVILKSCKIGCIKCGKCERSCPQHAIKVTNGIPIVDYALCNSCNTCVEGCPTHVLALVENII